MLGVSRGRIIFKRRIFVGTSLSPTMTQISDCWSAWSTGFLAGMYYLAVQDSFLPLIIATA